jgi:ribosome-associated toxin RatA of RatAB toxin-antitoxin module
MLFLKLLLIVSIGTGAAMLCGAGTVFQPVFFSSNEKAGVDEIKARFYVDADPQTAWNVLTDYEHIPRFVPDIKKSHVEEKHDDYLLLTQEAESGFLFITKRIHMLLRVQEVPIRNIYFNDVGKKDFYFYEGSWDIQPCPQGGVSVVYELEAKKNFDEPFAGDYLHGGEKDLLKAVQKEIYLRQLQARKDPVPTAGSAVKSATIPATAHPAMH